MAHNKQGTYQCQNHLLNCVVNCFLWIEKFLCLQNLMKSTSFDLFANRMNMQTGDSSSSAVFTLNNINSIL